MADHAKFSPSGAHRWIACPGSIRLEENFVSQPSTYAMEGTALHKVTEQCLREKIDPKEFIGMSLDSPKDDPDWSMKMDEDHADAVQYCVDEVRRISQERGINGGKLEVKVYLTDDCWGTVDVLLWNDEWLIVIDFKFGRGTFVEATGNPQLMIYYLGALKMLSQKNYLQAEGLKIPSKAMLVIIQPRIPDAERTRVWETTLEKVKTWYIKSVKPAFEEAGAMNAPCNPGEHQCKFCSANGVCQARADYLLGVAEREFADYAIDETGISTPEVRSLATDLRSKMDGALDQLTPDIAGKILAYQPDFDNFFSAVGEYALKAALAGTPIPGYKLVYGKSNRKWAKGDADVRKLLRDDFGIEEPYNKKTLSPAQAEKKVGKKRKEYLAEYIIKPKGKVILVDESDTREEVSVAAEKDMEEFVDQSTIAPDDETATGINPDDVTVFEDNSSIDDIMADFDGDSNEDEEESKVDTILTGAKSSPPSKTTKKFKLMEMGKKGGVSIQEAADLLFKGDRGQVTRGLRSLNERDGYTIIYHGDKAFTVKEVS